MLPRMWPTDVGDIDEFPVEQRSSQVRCPRPTPTPSGAQINFYISAQMSLMMLPHCDLIISYSRPARGALNCLVHVAGAARRIEGSCCKVLPRV